MLRNLSIPALLAVLGLAIPAVGSAEDQPGVFKIPGTESTIKFYGYAQLDMTLDLGARPGDIENNDWATLLPAIPANGTPDEKQKKPQLYMTARTTRFGIQTSTPTAAGPVGVRIEGDFNGPNSFQSETFTNSVLFRLRHGYGTFGGLLVGQTWTTFLDFGGAPETVDFNGPGTLALVRNPMIRYTFDFGGGTTLAVAAENARGAQFGGSKFQTLPDFHANLGFSGKWGSASVRGVTQYFRQTFTDAAGNTLDQSPASKFTVGGAASAGLKLGGDTLNLQYGGGPGIGRYMLNALGTGASGAGAYSVVGTNLELWTVHGGHVGFTHVWNPAFRSSLVGAAMFAVDPNLGGAPATNSAQKQWLQAFVNTFYAFAKNAEFGIEFAWGEWKSFSTATSPELKGTQYRVNSSFHYNFF
ncbi:MAG TPA: DcaP family trimeric outer membrane transporter [Anaeromyxobacteraceae bacterium]|nr:DcaP family trimeric outer membrane transporter [Anaeromyxobacteraceae bacterium]